jgi:CRISPR-associated protein Cmr5
MAKRDLDQERAAFAWKCAEEGKGSSPYANLTKSAPALIMNNGLMQTLAFYKQKGKDEHRMLLKHLCDWLATQSFAEQGGKDFSHVMKKLHSGTSLSYRQATEEALAFLKWLRQFASALNKD